MSIIVYSESGNTIRNLLFSIDVNGRSNNSVSVDSTPFSNKPKSGKRISNLALDSGLNLCSGVPKTQDHVEQLHGG